MLRTPRHRPRPLVAVGSRRTVRSGATRGSRARPATAVAATVATAAGLAGLTACASAHTVPVAPHATDPVCASIVLALPEQLGGLERVTTTSQATAAWGTQASAVELRCGVDVPGPTTDACQAIVDSSGTSVDWLVVPDGDAWVFTTYGRSPAVEVRVPPGVATAPVVDLNRAVSAAEQTRFCY